MDVVEKILIPAYRLSLSSMVRQSEIDMYKRILKRYTENHNKEGIERISRKILLSEKFIDECDAEIEKAEKVLSILDGEMYNVMFMHYVEGRSWRSIAVAFHYCERSIYDISRKAKTKLNNYFRGYTEDDFNTDIGITE